MQIHKIKAIFIIHLLFGFLAYAESKYSFGYRLHYGTEKIETSEINSNFDDFDSSHLSSFFFRSKFNSFFSLELAPSAFNAETDSSQYTYQCNSLSIVLHTPGSLFIETSLGLGAGIFSISSSSGKIGEVQSNATVFRQTSFMSIASLGIGYSWSNYSFLFDTRLHSFNDDNLEKLNWQSLGVHFITHF